MPRGVFDRKKAARKAKRTKALNKQKSIAVVNGELTPEQRHQRVVVRQVLLHHNAIADLLQELMP